MRDTQREFENYVANGIEPLPAAILVLATEMGSIAYALRALGNADAATPMGAIEALGKVIIETGEIIANAIGGVGESIDGIGPE